MRTYALISIVLVAFCWINFAMADPNSVDCQCNCCAVDDSRVLYSNVVHLNRLVCDETECLNSCRSEHPDCEAAGNEIQAKCSAS